MKLHPVTVDGQLPPGMELPSSLPEEAGAEGFDSQFHTKNWRIFSRKLKFVFLKKGEWFCVLIMLFYHVL